MTEMDLGLVDQVDDSLGMNLDLTIDLGSLDNLVSRHLQDLKVCGEGKLYSGHLDSEEEFTLFVDDLKALGFSFSTENSKIYKNSRILFSSSMKNSEFKIPYFGSPFQIIKTSYLLCSQGGNYRPQLLSPLQQGHTSSKKRRFSLQPTKKIGCKAVMTVKCIRIFSEDCYKAKSSVYKDGSYENRLIMSKLNKDLASSSPPTGTLRFMVVMSTADAHNHTVVSTNLNQILHPRLREEIHKCAQSVAVCSVTTMRAHLKEFVRHMFEGEDRPKPDSLNRCYYPTDTSLRFHMRQAGFTIARSKRRTRNDDDFIVESEIEAQDLSKWEIDVSESDSKDRAIKIHSQIQPTIFATQTIKREKSALEQCIILRRVGNSRVKQNVDVDISKNQDYFDIQMSLEPQVFLIEDNISDENTTPEPCIIVETATDLEDQSSSDMDHGMNDNIMEFYCEEPENSNVLELDEEGTTDDHAQSDGCDLKTLCNETREDLKTMVRYTYLLQSPESILEMARLTQQLKEKMLSTVLMTNGSFFDSTDSNLPLQMDKKNIVDSIKKKYSDLPKNCKLRNKGKYVE